MILACIICFVLGTFSLTAAVVMITYKGTRYYGIDSLIEEKRRKYNEDDYKVYALLTGLSVVGVVAGIIEIITSVGLLIGAFV